MTTTQTIAVLALGAVLGVVAGAITSCHAPQQPAQQEPACSPIEDRAKLTLLYLAEAEPVVATGACKGFTPDTCPALEAINKRHEARRKAFVQCR